IGAERKTAAPVRSWLILAAFGAASLSPLHTPVRAFPQLCRTAKPGYHRAVPILHAAFRSRNHNEKDLFGARAGRTFAQWYRMEPRMFPIDRRERPDSVQQERAARQQELQRSYGHAKARR